MNKKDLIFFPEKTENVDEYVEQILNYTLKDNYEMEKLLLHSLIKMIFDIGVPEDEICPATVLFLLQQTNIGDADGNTLVDKMFMVAEQLAGDENYQSVYWYLKDTEDFIPSVIRLISVFQFYGTYFPEPIYRDTKLIYYPNNKKDTIYTIKEGTTHIFSHTFYDNPNIQNIKIPKTVEYIGRTAIVNCKNLTGFVVDKENEKFYSKYGILYADYENPTLIKYPSGLQNTSITIPKNIKRIATYAFEHCNAISDFALESSQTKLENSAFANCGKLDSIMLLDGNSSNINPNAFDGIHLNSTSTEKENDRKEHDAVINTATNLIAETKTPSQIRKMFDEYIVGHDEAKKTLAVAVYSHIMRCNNPNSGIGKSNILICGPTGCGKTEFARTIAKCLNVPFVTVDATSITETGMKGNEPTDMLKDLLIASNNDLETAQKGIIYIDEIDKLAAFGENAHRESYSKGVQQGLLKIVEGGVIPIRIENPLNPSVINFDTSNVLFIAGGAFSSLTTETPVEKNSPIGFTQVEEETKKIGKLTAKDFIKYGMTQEFIGRFPVIVQLHQLTENEIYRIMIEPKNSVVDQYKKLVKCMGSELNFDDELLHKIASDATKNGTGARGLRTIIEGLIENIIYELPDKKDIKTVVVHKGMMENHETAKYIMKTSKTAKTKKSKASTKKESLKE